MKRCLVLMAILAALAVPCTALASTLVIDTQNSSSGTTTVASGVSTQSITAISGTYVTDLAVGDTVIPNLSNYSGIWSIQINTAAYAAGYADAANAAVALEVMVEFTNINDEDHWAGASPYYLPAIAFNSGTSLYAKSFTVTGFDFARIRTRSGVTPSGRNTLRAIVQ